MLGYVIRHVTLDEIEALNAIDLSYTTAYGYEYTKAHTPSGWRFELSRKQHQPLFEREYDWDWREVDELRQRIAQKSVWAAFAPKGEPRGEQGERAIGILEIREDEWNRSSWIQSLYVDREHRGQGIGKALFEVAVAHARQSGARALFVETQVSNGPAIDFYLACGLAPCGINDHLYTNDDIRHDEVALFLVLPFG